MTRAPARSRLLVGLAAVALLLVGGRWLALETAERAWAASVTGGSVYLTGRDFARLVHGVALLLAIAWGTANLYYVYRAIGSVQLPRRLGDLEIVEAVPQRVLLGATVASGLLYGLLLALGSGGWWLAALLASRPPRFGIVDPMLHRDLGLYLGELPWAATRQHFTLLATTTAVLLVGLLYTGIGSLRWSGWRPVTSPHARGHLGLLLALVALVLARGAALDPAEAVAGLHGTVDQAALDVRLAGTRLVLVLGAGATLASILWGVRDTSRALVATWGALLLALLGAYVVAPALARGPASADTAVRNGLEQLAFGAQWREDPPPRGFPTVNAAVSTLPLWDADRVAALARRAPLPLRRPGAPVAGVALALPRTREERPVWVLALAPAGSASPPSLGAPDGVSDTTATRGMGWTGLHRGPLAWAGPPLTALEVDSGLALSRVVTRDSACWFGSGFREFAVASPDTWPELRPAGIPLAGWWRRTALAWVLQSPELARAQTDGLVLLWRRDVIERLERLAPFASFEAATPLLADGALWWVSYGYVSAAAFPLVRPLAFGGAGAPVRYWRAGLVGVVAAAGGATRLYLAPGADSLASAWARLFAPLIRPTDSLPPGIRRQLPFPRDAFRAAATLLRRQGGDSTEWRPEPRDPYDVVAPADSGTTPDQWLAQGFATGSPPQLTALLAGTMTLTGPGLRLWKTRAPPPVLLPGDLLGSAETAPGTLRLWTADGVLLTEQGLFDQPATSGAPRRVSQVYLTWGDREGQGLTAAAALRSLLASRGAGGARASPGDTSLSARWALARHLAAQADSALRAGDLDAFSRLDGELRRLFRTGRTLAPTRERR